MIEFTVYGICWLDGEYYHIFSIDSINYVSKLVVYGYIEDKILLDDFKYDKLLWYNWSVIK